MAKEVKEHAKQAKQPEKTVDEVAIGFIRVANETMCRPIRALTQMRVTLNSNIRPCKLCLWHTAWHTARCSTQASSLMLAWTLPL